MSKQAVEIDVPEGYVATGETRLPVSGEFFIDADGNAAGPVDTISTSYVAFPCVILRPVTWRAPKALVFRKPLWFAMNSDGRWWMFNARPTIADNGKEWTGDGSFVGGISWLVEMTNFTLPEVSDWRESLHCLGSE